MSTPPGLAAGGAVLLVDKPAGPTSFAVVAAIRRALGRPVKVGHAGTLDPFATGLLLVLAGRATRLAPYLVGLPKRYEAVLRLGARSSTGDPEGEIEPSGAALPGAQALAAAAADLVGEIEQVPPATSAIKVDGRRAYALARAGQEVALAPRRVTVHELELRSYDERSGLAEVAIACSKGTYVRALARDLGELTGCGAYCEQLRRTAIGELRVEAAASPERIAAGPLEGPWLRTPAQALAHLPAREASEAERRALLHGRAITVAGERGPTALLHDGALLCVAEPAGGELRPRVVLEAAP
jgi:tRNA pseudouridine55 synthase